MTRLIAYLCLRYRVMPGTVRRAFDHWEWRMNAVGSSPEDAAVMLAIHIDHGGRQTIRNLADGPRVPATWWDES